MSKKILKQVWKRSGAWFFKGIPKYVLPEKKLETSKLGGQKGHREMRGSMRSRPGSVRGYNTWSRGRASHGQCKELHIYWIFYALHIVLQGLKYGRIQNSLLNIQGSPRAIYCVQVPKQVFHTPH